MQQELLKTDLQKLDGEGAVGFGKETEVEAVRKQVLGERDDAMLRGDREGVVG